MLLLQIQHNVSLFLIIEMLINCMQFTINFAFIKNES